VLADAVGALTNMASSAGASPGDAGDDD